MAFNKIHPPSGPYWLAPGGSTRIWIAWSPVGDGDSWGGDDHGATWIMADPVDLGEGRPVIAPGVLTVSDFTKVRTFMTRIDGNSIFIDLSRTVVRYEVTVTNTGSREVFFTVQGGGNT